jgi:GNAT superfamily N-acetyltransferase
MSTRDNTGMRIERHTGPRSELRALFELAEDSAAELDGYIDAGEVLVATEDGRRVGHLQLTQAAGAAEIKNMAVVPDRRGSGVGRALIAAAVELAREQGHHRMIVATGAADVGNLRFYQRAGFRMRSIDRDAFTEATGYPPGIVVDGIELRDRVWFDREIAPAPSSAR